LKKDVDISGKATKRMEQKLRKRQARKCRRFYVKASTLKEKVHYSALKNTAAVSLGKLSV
jgi:hypothetical protein